VLGLSVDPTFGHCVDALVVVDLDRTPVKLLRRFTGGSAYSAARASAPSTPIVEGAGG
jgi:hypothetical protein